MVFAISNLQQNLCSLLNSGDWFEICSNFHSSEAEFLIIFLKRDCTFQSNLSHNNIGSVNNEELFSTLDSICKVLFEAQKFPFSRVKVSQSQSNLDGCFKQLIFHKFSTIVQSLSAVYVKLTLSIENDSKYYLRITTRAVSTCILPCSIPLAPLFGAFLFWIPFPDLGANADYLHEMFQFCAVNVKQLQSNDELGHATVLWNALPSINSSSYFAKAFSSIVTEIPDSLKFFSFVILLPMACITFLLLS